MRCRKRRSSGTGAPGAVDDGRLARWTGRLAAIRDEGSEVSSELKAALTAFRDAMWLGLGIVRTEAGLSTAAAHAGATEEHVAGMRIATLGELVAATELGHLAAAARASAASALFRSESRAAHYREDHPGTDPAWVATVAYAGGRAWRRPLAVDPGEAGQLGRPAARTPGADEFVE
jgi:succinate dehydrogenase/fumarate reductase flavoprotein subunit